MTQKPATTTAQAIQEFDQDEKTEDRQVFFCEADAAIERLKSGLIDKPVETQVFVLAAIIPALVGIVKNLSNHDAELMQTLVGEIKKQMLK